MSWASWVTEEKQRAYLDICNLLLQYASLTQVISTEKLLKFVDDLGYEPDDVRFMYWTLVGQGKLVRKSEGVIRSLDIPNMVFTTFGTNYGN